ncbi:MAG: hypothetical protein CMI79_02395 [Candidatus Pelagibacter sp.]|nr:hypothetical protein [Candidatus Pelagibacter sp.]|tara:strand:- start:4794 stop:5981 length:1188 start_codon:yes stop_codon:yes gene_type:complete
MFEDKINTFIGNKSVVTSSNEIFDKLILDFLSDLSKTIFLNSKKIKYKEIIAFGYWCRKANLEKFKKVYLSKNIKVGKGLVFHVVPSNVPINFAYSLVFGLLSGNSNIVRVGEEKNDIVKSTCKFFNLIIKKKKYKKIYNENTVITYKKDENITKYFSLKSDCRILWGSDETIKTLRNYDRKVNCTDLIFADRYSISVIDIRAVNKGNLDRLVYNYFNDTFLMDQNACSSPHLMVWINLNKSNEKIKNLFWEKLAKLSLVNYDFDISKSYEKLSNSFENILKLEKNTSKFKNFNQILHITKIKKIPKKIENVRGKFGSFYEFYGKNFDFLNKIQSDKLQTISYFGLDSHSIEEKIKKIQLKKLCRFVPIGSTLDLDLMWDGYDVINNLSKTIVIK